MSIDDVFKPAEGLSRREENKQRMIAYARAQCLDMRAIYAVNFARDGDHGRELDFKDFLPMYVELGYAKKFHDENYHKYFPKEQDA